MRVAPLGVAPSNATLEKTRGYQDLTQEEKIIVEKKKNDLVSQEQLIELERVVVLHELKSEIPPKSKEIQTNVNIKNGSSTIIGSSDEKELVEELEYFDFNMDEYKVIHIPSVGKSPYCSEIARKNQYKILTEYKGKKRVVWGDAEMYVNDLKEKFKKQKKKSVRKYKL